MLILWISTATAGAYEDALVKLQSYTTWCKAADTLAKMKRPEALAPILAAFETNLEVPRGCLLDALDVLADNGAVEANWASDDPTRKRAALRTMQLASDPKYVPALVAATLDPAWEEVALAALLGQLRDPAWEQAMLGLLTAPSPTVRVAAVRNLKGRSPAIDDALAARLAVETNPAVRLALLEAPPR